MGTRGILILVTLIIAFQSYAEIKNGYKSGVDAATRSLIQLNKLYASSDARPLEKRKLLKAINSHKAFFSNYYVTQELLKRFRLIAPDMYDELDNIKNSDGQKIDVFVKFICPKDAAIQAEGLTNIALALGKNSYTSEYGDDTVSVIVWITARSLVVLAHEFGHVKYQVANLQLYYKFYKENYLTRICDPNFLGHDTNDLSGQSAFKFESKFKQTYHSFIKKSREEHGTASTLMVAYQKSDSLSAPIGRHRY